MFVPILDGNLDVSIKTALGHLYL